MQAVSIYNQRGEIVTTLRGDTAAIDNTLENTGASWVDGDWLGKPVYVLNGEVVPRPENPTTLHGLTLENVPVPSTIVIGGTYYEATESTVELSFNLPGTYRVKVISWPYLDKEITVENPAP